MTIPDWSTACQDWEARIAAGHSLIPCQPLFPEEAAAGVEVMSQLRIVDAPGSPTIGEACAPWVMDFAGSVFGSYNTDTGRREIKEYFLCLPKKNSKSTIAASIMLTLLIRNWRESAELIILAPTIEVANNAFAPARDMIKHDDELSDLLHVQDHVRTITHRVTGATLKVVAADSNTVGGKKASFILIDELHLFGSMAKAENMLREATGGLASRPEGCIIYLTTQSDQPPAGVFLQKLQYARQVRDGKLTDKRFLPVLYEFPKAIMDANEHLNPANFGMVNPNLGYSVDREFLEREFEKAKDAGEESLRGFMSKFLNVEIGLALLSNRWAGADFWEGAGDSDLTLTGLFERSEVVVFGIDGGGLDDLLGLSAIGRCKDTRKWLHWAHAWAHEIVLQRRKEIAPRLLDFQREGTLTIVKRPGEDVHQLADTICMARDLKLLPEKNAIGVDAAGIGAIVEELTSPGRKFTDDHIVAISQGWRLNGAIKTVERMIAGGEFIHGATEMMSWCVGNARVVQVGNAITINKQVSGTAKIDPLMATFDAASLMALNPEAPRKKLVLATAG